MSISISLEEYELFKAFKEQIEDKKKKKFNLNMKIIEHEEKMHERAIFYEKEKRIAYETLSIINKEIDKARICLEDLKKECDKDKKKKKIAEIEKKLLCAIKEANLDCS